MMILTLIFWARYNPEFINMYNEKGIKKPWYFLICITLYLTRTVQPIQLLTCNLARVSNRFIRSDSKYMDITRGRRRYLLLCLFNVHCNRQQFISLKRYNNTEIYNWSTKTVRDILKIAKIYFEEQEKIFCNR